MRVVGSRLSGFSYRHDFEGFNQFSLSLEILSTFEEFLLMENYHWDPGWDNALPLTVQT